MFYKADFILRLTDFQEWTPRVEAGTPCQLDTVCFGNSCWIACTVTVPSEYELVCFTSKNCLSDLYTWFGSLIWLQLLSFFLWSHFGHKQAHKFTKKTNLWELSGQRIRSLFTQICTTKKPVLSQEQWCSPADSPHHRKRNAHEATNMPPLVFTRTYNVWWGITNQAAAEQQNAACCNLSEPEWAVLIRISTSVWVMGLKNLLRFFFFYFHLAVWEKCTKTNGAILKWP